ncbi:uncharacterized protein CXorf66 homolog [Canis aureus]
MNLFICVLLLFIWTNSCLNTNQSDESSTTGAKHGEPVENKMDDVRRRLLIIVIGIMITSFVFTCFCFLHYNCMSDDAPKAGTFKKEDVTAKPFRSSKISLSQSKIATPCGVEKQAMLPSTDKFSGPSSPEKSSMPSTAEKSIRPLYPGKQCLSSSTEKLNKSSSQEKSCRPSRQPKKLKSSYPEKSYRIHSLEKQYKLAHAHKLGGQACSSYSNKAVKPPWPDHLQYPDRPTKPSCPRKRKLPPRRSSFQKLTKSPRYRNLKRSVSTDRACILSRPQLIKPCRCCKEKCLVCRASSEPLVNVSEAMNGNAQNSPFPSEATSFSKFFHKADNRDNALCGNMSSSDLMTYDSDDSDREVTIICNIKCNEAILKDAQEN